MDLSSELQQYADFMSMEDLQKAIKKPLSLCPEEVAHVIPSFNMGSDGPVLASLFLVTDHYLVEIRLNVDHDAFDFIDLRAIGNYLFELSEQDIKGGDGTDIHYELATVTLRHTPLPTIVSTLTYVGSDRASWLGRLTQAIPVSLVRTD